MIVDKSHCGLTFRHPRVSRVHQEAELRKAGASWVLNIGVDCPSWRHATDQLEPGDVLYIYSGPMVPLTRAKTGRPLHVEWSNFMSEVHLRGAVLVEVSTGRRSNVRKELNALNTETHSLLRQGGRRLPKTATRHGRKPKVWPSDDVKAAAFKLWKSKNIESDKAAVRQIMEQWADLVDDKGRPLVTERLVRKFPRSGRNA